MEVIDFHSHVLPGIDDGSRNIETSLEMLRLSRNAGVERMIATPHFYADEDRIEHFLEKREHAYHSLMEAVVSDNISNIPQLMLGAEVAFFDGIGDADKVDQLTIQGSDLLLLEMPFRTWTDTDLLQVKKLIRERNLRIIIAHLERFMKISGNKPYIEKLMELPVTIQINAESLSDWKQGRTLIHMFQKGQAHILGSDCHGVHHRPPNLMEGRQRLEKKAGKNVLEEVDAYGCRLLGLS